jgi:hypothetical protein
MSELIYFSTYIVYNFYYLDNCLMNNYVTIGFLIDQPILAWKVTIVYMIFHSLCNP